MDCHSESIPSSDDDVEPSAKRLRTTLNWETIGSFKTKSEAHLYVKSFKSFNYNTKGKSANDTKLLYLCNVNDRCPARCRIRLPKDSDEVFVDKTSSLHNHEPKIYGIQSPVKNAIRSLVDLGIRKPNLILKNLEKAGHSLPSKMQLNNFLTRGGSNNLSLGQLEKLCKEHASAGDELDKPFVLSYEIHYEFKQFRVAFSTRRLLSMRHMSEAIQTDATYKLLYQGFPVLLAGTSDKKRVFHPFLMGVTHGETEVDFKFIFKCLKYDEYCPKILIADCADSITNAFNAVFGLEFTRVHCWAHVIRNVDKRLRSLKGEWKSQIRSDILSLQLAKTCNEFSTAKIRFLKKWEPILVAQPFLEYFKREYLETYTGWYEGVAQGYPSTNNGLESTNNVIKNEATLRERLSLPKFFEKTFEILNSWSKERDITRPNSKSFAQEPEFDLSLMTKSFEFTQSPQALSMKCRKINDTSSYWFILPSGKEKSKLKDTEINGFINMSKNQSYKTFDSYKQFQSRMWQVTISVDISFKSVLWNQSTCTCPPAMKKYICHHILGLAVILKLFALPPESKNLPIGSKRKRGRPAKSTKALIID